MTELEALRERVDLADEALLEALAQRMEVVDIILREKEANGLPLFDEERENALLQKVTKRAVERQLDPRLAERVLREVIRHSREVQARRVQEERNPDLKKAARVAFQGAKGAYSWLACRKHFGEAVQPVGYNGFEEAIEALETGQVDLALLPIENVLAGSIYDVYDGLVNSRLHVVGEEVIKIEHCLIGLRGVSLGQIHSVLSHPVALQQCVHFVRGLPNATRRSYVDSAEAVRKVKLDGDPSQAAIASREAARLYGLEVLREDISDHPENYTRFWVVAREPVQVDLRIPAKTSLLLVTEHREGALVACLTALAEEGINMTKLESRPRKGMPWQYQFHLDMEGNVAEERMVRALDEVRSRARVMRVLGCYPRAEAQASNGSPKSLPLPAESPPPRREPLASRLRRALSTVVQVGDTAVGGDQCVVMIEANGRLNEPRLMEFAEQVVRCGGHALRVASHPGAGTRPASALKAASLAARAHGLLLAAEVDAPQQVEAVAHLADLLEVGARNMQNFSLLSQAAKVGKPLILTRGMTSTLEELLAAAEHILTEGNQQVILCEQGIRTFEKAAGCTLDLAALAALKDQTHLPVVVNPVPAAVNAERILPLARAVREAGADGLMLRALPAGAAAKEGPVLTMDQLRDLTDWLARGRV